MNHMRLCPAVPGGLFSLSPAQLTQWAEETISKIHLSDSQRQGDGQVGGGGGRVVLTGHRSQSKALRMALFVRRASKASHQVHSHSRASHARGGDWSSAPSCGTGVWLPLRRSSGHLCSLAEEEEREKKERKRGERRKSTL